MLSNTKTTFFISLSKIAGLALGIPYSKITVAVQKGIGDRMAQ
ncbi:MAG: hypothetical protein PHC28_00605 [Flavobacterium sp.]|nr:hypothetical protein [Flavobacterium sp.]MDD5148967.1 hypothetical protein [Flavobacterium sp.]